MINAEICKILEAENITWTGEQIASRLNKAGYIIVPKEPSIEKLRKLKEIDLTFEQAMRRAKVIFNEPGEDSVAPKATVRVMLLLLQEMGVLKFKSGDN